jgi:hypothetical protein
MKNIQSLKSVDDEFVEKVKALRMPIYRCSCGGDILVVPDLAAMNKAIQQHIGHHNRITGDRLSEETLTNAILRVISKMTPLLSDDY